MACFHKFFEQLFDLAKDHEDESKRYHLVPLCASDKNPTLFSNLDGFRPIQKDLLSDLESLIPGYFD